MASQHRNDLMLSDRLIKRRYVQIPKDQQAHLENAWSETLNHGQHPMFNIPNSVLQDVKNFQERKYVKPMQPPASSAQRPSTAGSASLPPRSSRSEQVSSSPQQDLDDQASWSASPDHHLHAQRLGDEDESVGQRPVESEVELSPPAVHRPSSPLRSPPKRKIAQQFINNEPQSSGANSEGLDFEPPGFVVQAVEPPVNRNALRAIATNSGKPELTPPSAQIPIGASEHPAGPSPAKKRRVKEDVRFAGDNMGLAEPLAVTSASQKPLESNQNSLTTSTSASSPAAGTHFAKQKPTQPGAPKILSDPTPYPSLTPTFEGRQRETAGQHLVITGNSTPGLSYSLPPAQRKAAAKGLTSTSQEPLKQAEASRVASYEAFRLAYPDYSRPSRDFVIALLSVKQLRRDRALHESLYDDYIRAYSSDYFAYISECSRKQPSKIMPGVQWYNENVEDVLYTRKVVRKNNLSDFLKAHTEEAHSIRRALADSQSTESAVENSDEDMEAAHVEDDESEQEEYGLEAIELLHDDADSRASPELHVESPGPATQPSQLHNQAPLTVDDPTEATRIVEIVEQHVDEELGHMSDEDNAPEPPAPVEADNTRSSPESQIEPASVAKVTIDSNGWPASPTRKSPAPSSAKSFASQEGGLEFSRPISSSPEITRLAHPHTHARKQTQEAPTNPPPQRAVRSSSSATARALLASGENGEEEDEDVAGHQVSTPPRTAAASPSLRRSRIISADKDIGEDDASGFQPPVPQPQRTAGPPSTSMSRRFSVENKQGKGASGPGQPLASQRNARTMPTDRVRNSAADRDEEKKHGPNKLPITSPLGRSTHSAVDEAGDTDEDDAFDPPPLPREVTPGVPASKITSSTMPALKSSLIGQKNGTTAPTKADTRLPSASSPKLEGTGRHYSAGPSVGSSASMPRSKKRPSETPEQRSLRLKAFMHEQVEKRKRLSSGTPASTLASKG